MCIVLNLATGEKQEYSCSPDQAVIAAYAQSHHDWNTWDYGKRYNHMLETGKHTYLCGDFTALNVMFGAILAACQEPPSHNPGAIKNDS